jgi:hypothetical protein
MNKLTSLQAQAILHWLQTAYQEKRIFKLIEITKECGTTHATVYKWLREFKYCEVCELDYQNSTKRRKDGMYSVKYIDLSKL